MRRTARVGSRLIITCVAIGALLAVAGPAPAAGGGWRLRPPVTSADLNTVELIATNGWAAGADGTILRTQDGGMTWTPQGSGSSAWLSDISFADARAGWAVGAQTVLATTDAGATWARQSTPGGEARAVDAVDPAHAWIAGGDGSHALILTTADGHTWSRQDTGDGPVLIDVCFSDAAHGCAVGYGGEFLTTADGGGTWVPRDAGCTAMLTSVSFSDADSGWVAGTLGSGVYASRAVLLVTSDGGQTWTRAYTSASTGTFFAVDRLDGRRGWAVGTFDGVRNAIMATADGGSTWELQGVAASEVNGIAMVDALHGCVVGNGGAVLGTTGGGASTDTAPPVTSVRGGGDGWRQRWVLRFVASDGVQGSGVARVQSSTAARGRWATDARASSRPATTTSTTGCTRCATAPWTSPATSRPIARASCASTPARRASRAHHGRRRTQERPSASPTASATANLARDGRKAG